MKRLVTIKLYRVGPGQWVWADWGGWGESEAMPLFQTIISAIKGVK